MGLLNSLDKMRKKNTYTIKNPLLSHDLRDPNNLSALWFTKTNIFKILYKNGLMNLIHIK